MTQTPLNDPEQEKAPESTNVPSPAESAWQRESNHQPLHSAEPEQAVAAATDPSTTDDTSLSAATSDSTSTPFVDVHIGQLIGTIQIEERLGTGAMASIYRGRDIEHGTQMAIKVLSSAADEVLQERFRIEARTVRTLDHPHIVKVVDSGQSKSGLTYIAMDLIEGEDLGTLLERQHQLSVPDACRILRPIADALAYAHAAGVVHRDVKPSNILLRRVAPGTPTSVQLTGADYAVIPLLSDFGIARALDAPELTTAGRTIGTPAYMSPEQCAGNRALDGRADIYSLGTVLYRCLVGRPPFVGATTQILHAHVYEALTIPDALADELSPAVLAILQKSLQKEPADRYADPAEFAVALSQLAAQHPTPALEQPQSPPLDSTATMPSLPSVGPVSAQATVLVPGVREHSQPRPGNVQVLPPGSAGAAPVTATASATTPAAARRRTEYRGRVDRHRTARRTRGPVTWVAVLLGILLTTGVALVAFLLLITLTPDWLRFTPSPAVVDGAVAVTDASLPTADSTAGVAGGGSIGAATSTNTPPVDLGGLPLTASVTPSATVDITATEQRAIVQSTDDLNVAATWDDVLHYYQMGDWGQTRWSLMSMLSVEEALPDLTLANSAPIEQAAEIDAVLLSDPDAMYWIMWGDSFQPEEVGKILADTYVGLAMMEPDPLNLPPTTIEYLQAAATVLPNDPMLRRLSATTARFLNADPGQQDFWMPEMAEAYTAYAAARFADNAYCIAADTADAINTRVSETIAAATVKTYRDRCTGLIASIAEKAEEVRSPRNLNGMIYYSTELDGRYVILRTNLITDSNPGGTVILENAAQPSIKGSRLAFYSRRSDSQGLSGVDLAASFNPNSQFSRYTGAVEDAQQSPPRWNPTANQLVFSSGKGSGLPYEIFSIPADFVGNNSTKQSLGFGEDPAWSPDGNWIVFRGTGAGGSGLGLYIMSAGGQERQQLTNGDDRRPVWTTDGNYIVFMRRVDGNNWDLFRYDYGTGDTFRLTDDEAQDGLPALSPDGQTIVFASDRVGQWQLWIVPLAGGESELLMPIQGTLLQWLEHAITWVN
ncbi:MAG: serine/threonine-protein kinase [Caldilineaceae bacterium]|nr:serine/threonine-protein kinase [Caldilineaceae bacterium]